MSGNAQLGLIGQAVMGRNLSLNLLDHGICVALWDREWQATQATMQQVQPHHRAIAAQSVEEFVAALQRPRVLWLMVRAGAPVDATIDRFLPHLQPGDLILDGGNSHPDETTAREARLAAHGLLFVGMGVSGGEEGARHGPSLMPGGSPAAYARLAPLLEQIAAKVGQSPCVAHVGKGAAGHLVKTLHNGIEYGDMQLLAEAYDLMQQVHGMSADAMADAFAAWNAGALESFLVEITARILREKDPATGRALVEVIDDRAGQKGTGRWSSELALRHGIAAPTLQAAVQARYQSADQSLRQRASALLSGPALATWPADRETLAELGDALLCSKLCSYAQGFHLLATINQEQALGMALSEVARIWQGGCIIRARCLQQIEAACQRDPQLPHLLLDAELAHVVQQRTGAWRRVLGRALAHGVPVPAMSASLAYFDALRRARLPQNLTQAQRDYFGAHGFARVDQPGEGFHHPWQPR